MTGWEDRKAGRGGFGGGGLLGWAQDTHLRVLGVPERGFGRVELVSGRPRVCSV